MQLAFYLVPRLCLGTHCSRGSASLRQPYEIGMLVDSPGKARKAVGSKAEQSPFLFQFVEDGHFYVSRRSCFCLPQSSSVTASVAHSDSTLFILRDQSEFNQSIPSQIAFGLVHQVHRVAAWATKIPCVIVCLARFRGLGFGRLLDDRRTAFTAGFTGLFVRNGA